MTKGDTWERYFLRRHQANEDAIDNIFNYSKPEPNICKKFGCCISLTPLQTLFSEYCFKHQKNGNTNVNH